MPSQAGNEASCFRWKWPGMYIDLSVHCFLLGRVPGHDVEELEGASCWKAYAG